MEKELIHYGHNNITVKRSKCGAKTIITQRSSNPDNITCKNCIEKFLVETTITNPWTLEKYKLRLEKLNNPDSEKERYWK